METPLGSSSFRANDNSGPLETDLNTDYALVNRKRKSNQYRSDSALRTLEKQQDMKDGTRLEIADAADPDSETAKKTCAINKNHGSDVAAEPAQNISPETSKTVKPPEKPLLNVAFSQIDLNKLKDVQLNIDDIAKEILNECREKYEPVSIMKDTSGKFEQLSFICQFEAKDALLSQLGFNSNKTISQCIIFYFRINDDKAPEMFAVTTGHAWKVIQKFADFSFSAKIANRLLSQDGMCERTEMPLFGEQTKFTTVFADPQPAGHLLSSYIISFVSKLRENASILKLKCFLRPHVFVRVGSQIIRFEQRFSLEHIASVVGHFSEISRGKDTFENSVETSNIERDFPEAQSNGLVKVEKRLKTELDHHLAKLIFAWLQPEDAEIDFGNFHLGHNHTEQFARASKFQLKWQLNEAVTIKEWDTCPKISEVMTAIRNSHQYQTKQVALPDTVIEDIPKWFSQLRFTFKNDNGGEPPKQKLLYFINGHVEKDGQIYWHLNNQWFHVLDAYLSLINSEFRDLIRKCLISKDKNEYLGLKYANTNTAVSENNSRNGENNFKGEYKEKYKAENNCIVLDEVLVNNIEMFDLLFYDEHNENIFLYYITEGFGQKTDICSQIINSSNLFSGRLHSGEFDEFCNDIVQIYKGKLSKICGNVTEFKEALKKAHFVYAVAESAKSDKSFNDEINKKTTIYHQDLENKLKEMGKKKFQCLQRGLGCEDSLEQVTAVIISKLKTSGYADSQTANVTAKLENLTEESFLEESKEWFIGDRVTRRIELTLRAVFNKLFQLYCTSYDSKIGKLEMLRIPLKLAENDYNDKFMICQIEMEESPKKSTSLPNSFDLSDLTKLSSNTSNELCQII